MSKKHSNVTNRRNFLIAGGSLLGLGGMATLMNSASPTAAVAATTPPGPFEVEMSKAEWKTLLTPKQFAVLREHATERPFTSPLNDEKRAGIFHCAGCDLPLYSSETKYDSGTGWPSFWEALPNAVGTQEDRKLFRVRTEVHCRRCGGHQGHVFDDGPQPTGKRHCINGVAMTFKAAAA